MVSMNSSSQNGEGSAGIVVVSTGNGGSNIADSGSTRSGITSLVECNINNNSNNNNDKNCSAMDTNSWKGFQDSSKMNKLREIVENSTSVSSKCVVDSLLQQINQLTDVEKCYLYFKLPTGRSPEQDPLKQPLNPLGSRSEIQLTITWMKTHLGIDLEVSLPKEEVYNEYKLYCANNDFKPLSTADFGKVMKQVFPSVRARRLGQRGMSKYCHSGLRKNYVLDVPSLPDLSDTSSNSGNSSCNKSLFGLDSTTDENQKAILCVVMEWAEKHFKMKFDTFKDLAIFLLENNCVDNRSVSAFTLLSLDHSTGTNTVGKHRETQFQLQKKLQEREQKRKLQEQQPGMSRPCLERSKARRRSGASRNSSGGSNSSGSSEIRSLSSGATVGGASKNTLIDNHEPKNLIRGTVKQDSDVPDICLKKENAKEGKSLTLDPVIAPPSLTTGYSIKQEDNTPSHRHPLPSIVIGGKEKVNSVENTISHVVKSPQKFIRGNSCGGEEVVTISNSSSFVTATKGTANSNSSYFMLSNPQTTTTTTSSKNRYKPIQPKVGQCESNNSTNNNNNIINNNSNNNNSNNNVNNIINNNNNGSSNNNNNNNNNSLNIKGNTKCGITQSSESFQFYDTIYSAEELCSGQQNSSNIHQTLHSFCTDQPQSNFLQTNNNQPAPADQDDLMPSYSSCEVDDLQKSTQISELRKLLQKNLPAGASSPCIGLTPVAIGLADEHHSGMIDDPDSINSAAIRRKVSFQTSLDSNGNTITNILAGNINSTSQNVSCTKAFNFTPIPNPSCGTSSQCVSQASSANASPFMSPRNTPLPRSRHNSGQTSSAYLTPRSTPYTPDMSMQTEILSENSTPFMSPAPTPIPRSRHNSSQNMRSHYAPPCRIRHSSGAPSYRRTPYADDLCGRRNGNKHRHYSGSIPPSPQSAPLSPLVHDSGSHSLSEILHFNHQPMVSSSSSMQGGPSNVGNSNDLRRRHMSAGPTIHYQPQSHMQSVTYSNSNTNSSCLSSNDLLSQELSSLNNAPVVGNISNTTASSGNSNRPQSVPLPQMLSTAELDYLAKSHPNTPLINQQFHFNQDCNLSHHSSYAPTPVPSEYNDFVEYPSNLEFDSVDPVISADVTGANGGLEGISASFSGLSSHPDYSSAISDSFSSVSGTGITGINESSFVESGDDGTGTQYSQCDDRDAHAVSHVIACPIAPTSNSSGKAIINQVRDSVLLCTKNGDQTEQQQQQQQQQQRQNNQQPNVTQNLLLNGNSQITLNALNAHPLGLNVSDTSFETQSSQLEDDFTPTLIEFPDQVYNSLVLDINKD
ncbi:UNVERIFIED_CONTAM: hypothetical protein RMT77_008577 [Armadillidium vulgare]